MLTYTVLFEINTLKGKKIKWDMESKKTTYMVSTFVSYSDSFLSWIVVIEFQSRVKYIQIIQFYGDIKKLM